MIQPTPTSEFTLELSRVIKADPATIFAAWTDPQQLTQWLKPTPEFTHGKVSCDARKEGEYEIEFISPDECDYTFELGREKLMVNVGSVGQPRDDDRRSCYVVLDTDARTLNFRRVEYEIDRTANKIYDVPDLADGLGDRLKHGR